MSIVDRRSSAYDRIVNPPKGVVIRVGILERADEAHDENDDLTVLELATIHEFGTDNIPARSFIRGWFDENQTEIRNVLLKELGKAAAEGGDYVQAGERVVLWCVASIQKRISEGIDPPLAPATVARRYGYTVGRLNAERARASEWAAAGEVREGQLLGMLSGVPGGSAHKSLRSGLRKSLRATRSANKRLAKEGKRLDRIASGEGVTPLVVTSVLKSSITGDSKIMGTIGG